MPSTGPPDRYIQTPPIQTFGEATGFSNITVFTVPYVSYPLTLMTSRLSSTVSSLTAILVSRFLIDLQEANSHSVKVVANNSHTVPTYSSSDNFQPSLAFADGTISSVGTTTGLGQEVTDASLGTEGVEYEEGRPHAVERPRLLVPNAV